MASSTLKVLETTTTSADVKDGASNRNLTASIGRSTVFGIISSAVQSATRLVTVPITITHLGLGGYGIWALILTTANYMRFGSVGIKSAFQKYVAESTGNGDYNTASKLLSTGAAAVLGLSIAGLIPVAIFSKSIARASGVPPEFLQSAAQAISLLGLVMVLANVGAAYEAIVMGGHRIDLIRKFATVNSIGEATAMITLLRMGYGLLAMAVVMAISELVLVLCYYFAARRVVPQIKVSPSRISRTVVRELIRFAGSYQVVGILQLAYGAIVPIAVLRAYGADQAGVIAIVGRLLSPINMCQYAFLVPILSGAAMVYASGSTERMAALIRKAFKVTLLMTLFPLAAMCAFGTYFIQAWTGQTDSHFRGALWLLSLGLLLQSFSVLALVLYRTSGKAVLDNIREILRIGTLLPVVFFSHRLGLYGVLGGLAIAELVGMIFMLYALRKTFDAFQPRIVLDDAVKLSMATVLVIAAGLLAAQLPVPTMLDARTTALVRTGFVCLGILLAAFPALTVTKAVSIPEMRSVADVFKRKAFSGVRIAE